MSYDKKSGTINIESDDPKEFERDLISHMAHVSKQVDRELAGRGHRLTNASSVGQSKMPSKGSTVRWVAIVLNVALIGFVLYLLLTKGTPRDDEILVAVFLIATPIASLLALTVASGTSESLLSLYFKRKALEEKQRIRKLEGE